MGVILAGVSDLTEGYQMARRGHDCHVVLFSIGGRASYRERDDVWRPIRPGTLWVGPAGLPHHYRSGRTWRMLWFHLAPLARWSGLQAVRNRPAPDSAAAAPVVEAFCAEASRSDAWSSRAATGLADYIAAFVNRELAPGEDPAVLRRASQLREIWAQVDAHLSRRWTVEDLAEAMNVSAVHCHRIVVEHEGAPPMRVVTRLRMRRAEDMLRQTDYPLKVIAARVGYQSPFAFSHAFKRHAGVSPKAFRSAAARR